MSKQRRSGRLLALVASLPLAAALTAPQPAAAQSGGVSWPSDMDKCEGATAVVVASDPAAQTDVYSAVTLAGVLGTSCLIDAGARTAPMPAASVALLESANEQVWVMGGPAAVPDAKLHGLMIHRVGGADRWATARAAGAIAQQIAKGDTPAFETVNASAASGPATRFTAVSGGSHNGCGLSSDGRLTCWYYDHDDSAFVASDLPVTGTFTAVSGGGSGGCGVRSDGRLACWQRHWNPELKRYSDVVRFNPPVSGPFTAVSWGYLKGCGLRSDGHLACWHTPWDAERRWYSSKARLSGPRFGLLPFIGVTFAAVSGGGDSGCGVRSDGRLACWQYHDHPSRTLDPLEAIDLPVTGTFAAVSGSSSSGCGLRTDGRLACWSAADGMLAAADPPMSGTFTAVSGIFDGCGLRSGGRLACWSNDEGGLRMAYDLPVSGTFAAVSGGSDSGCGLRTDGGLACWYDDDGTPVSVDPPA